MMKTQITSTKNWIAAIIFAAPFILAITPARAQLDESCKVMINNQTVQVGFGGEFRIRNIPAGNNLLRIHAICTKGGKTRYGRSVFYQVQNRQTITLSELDFVWRDTPFPTTAAIIAVADNGVLNEIGLTTQIRVTATFSDSTKKDVTNRGFGSSYTSSNSSVASVDLQGRVTANGIGTALITVNNEGATAVTRITVAPSNLLTTVEGLVQLESGAAAVGATVVVPGFGETIVTDPAGKFSFSGLYAPLGGLKARAYNMVNNQLLLGITGNLRLIQGGITDAGIIVIKPVTNYVYWKDAVSGAWTAAARWSTGVVPTANDNVFIGVPGNITVTNSTTTTSKSLLCDENFTLSAGSFAVSDSSEMTGVFIFSGGTLTGSGNLSIFGQLNWTSGTMSGTGSTTIAASGTMTMNSFPNNLQRNVNNAGVVNWIGGGISAQNVVFNNLPGAVFDTQLDAQYIASGTGTQFNNAGTFRKSAGSGLTIFNSTPFNNSGAINVMIGTLSLSSGGTSTGGNLAVASGATLALGGTHIYSGNFTGSGNGTIRISGTLQVGVGGATFNLTGGGFLFDGGTIAGPGTLTNNGIMTWNSGTVTAQTIITNTGNISITSGVSKFFRGGAIINNSGTVTWTGTAGGISSGEGAIFNNLASGIFDIQVNTSFNGATFGGTRTAFNNTGRVIKSAGTGTTTLDITFNNANGAINVQTGMLTLSAGGTNTGGTYAIADTANLNLTTGTFNYTGGTINVTSGALNLRSGTHKFSGNYSGSGVGFIQLSGGTLKIDTTVVATFNFTGGGFQWAGGTITGPGTLTNAGNFSITSGVGKFFRGGAIINNSGTVTWTSTAGGISSGEGAIFNNLASGIFDIQVNTSFNGATFGGTRTAFNNTGRVIKSAGTGTTTLDLTFNNANGAINVQTGTLTLSAGGTNTSGTYAIADTANLNLTTGTFNYTGGTINVTSGALNLSSGTHKFSGNYSSSGVGFIQLSGGTLKIDTTVVVTFNFTSGGFQWAGGTITGPGTLTNTGNFSITGGISKFFRGGAIINNSGTVTWTSTAGGIASGEGAVFNNLASGIFDIQVNASFSGTAFGSIRTAFNNAGSVIKSAGTGTSTLDLTFNNANGAIDVQTGTLTLSAGGKKTGGIFTVATGANLNFSGTHVFSGNFTGTIDGTVDVGTLQIDAAGATFNFPGQGFTWTSGTITGPGTLTNAGNFSITSSFSKFFRGGAIINNSGTVTWTGNGPISSGEGAVFNNLASGTFDIQAVATFNNAFGGTPPAVNNAGTLLKSAGAGTTTFIGVPFTNTGTIRTQSGTLGFTGGFTQTAGATILNGGNLNSSTTLNIQGGSVSGAGTITANVSNGGAFSPGASPGILNISGAYTQTRPPQPLGALNIELNGTATTQFDQLKMTGAATLGGTLNLIPASNLNLGDSFVIMTFSGRGGTQFDNITGQDLGGGRRLNVIYNLTNVTVTVQVVASGLDR